jgi:hypothetical protein
MTLSYSNLLSNFSGPLNASDVLTQVSAPVTLTITSTTTSSSTYYGRYFVIGNLLIQFSSIDQGFPNQLNQATTYTLTYPFAYTSTPYSISLTGTTTGSNYPASITLQTFGNSSCTFRVSNNDGGFTFFVIGPRPSSL